MTRSPSQLRALAALTDAAASKNMVFAMSLHAMGRHTEGFEVERRVAAQETQACDLRIAARQSEASDAVRASIFETVQPRSAA